MGLGLLGTAVTRLDGIKDLLRDRIGSPVLNVSTSGSRLDPVVMEIYLFLPLLLMEYSKTSYLLLYTWICVTIHGVYNEFGVV